VYHLSHCKHWKLVEAFLTNIPFIEATSLLLSSYDLDSFYSLALDGSTLRDNATELGSLSFLQRNRSSFHPFAHSLLQTAGFQALRLVFCPCVYHLPRVYHIPAG
jgi:hypothetical protein